MSEDGEKSSNSNHVSEFRQRQCDKEFNSVLNVIKTSNVDPYKICPKRIIGEIDTGDAEFNSTEKFKKRLAKKCNKEINRDFINFDFDILSTCGKEIINNDHGSINFNKAALLLDSSVKVYSEKVDHLHSLVTQAAENVHRRSQPDQQKNVSEQTEEDDFWVPDDIEVNPNCTLDDTTTSLIKLVKPPADLVLEGDGLDGTGDGKTLESYTDSLLANISASEEQTELAARVSSWKQQIKQDLEEHEARPAYDINDYSKRVLHKLSQSADLENNVSFADLVKGEEKHDVARSFSALLHLANNGNVDIQRSDTNDEEFMSANPFSVRLLKHVKRRQQVELQSSKRRVVSQTNEGESIDKRGGSGKENHEP